MQHKYLMNSRLGVKDDRIPTLMNSLLKSMPSTDASVTTQARASATSTETAIDVRMNYIWSYSDNIGMEYDAIEQWMHSLQGETHLISTGQEIWHHSWLRLPWRDIGDNCHSR